jgi:hypothetical protein
MAEVTTIISAVRSRPVPGGMGVHAGSAQGAARSQAQA